MIEILARAETFQNHEHYVQTLSLSQLSRTMNTSRFCFYKLFRKWTAVTLTEFVSRTRIAQAKTPLLNPNLRLSEIAYAIGFQSLGNFNRVFERFVGRSPAGFRSKLPTAA